MKIYIVVTDVVNDVTNSRKSVNTRVVIRFLWHDFINWKTATTRHMIIILIKCLAFAASSVKVHYPKLYNMAHLLALNVLLLPRI